MIYARSLVGSLRLNLLMKNAYLQCPLQLANLRGVSISFKNQSHKADDITNPDTSRSSRAEDDNHTSFTTFYRFSLVRVGFALHKLKWYHTLAASAGVPSTALLCAAGITSYDILWSVSLTAIVFGCNLYGLAGMFDRAVGFVYLSENGEEVKFAYLDFWGRRVDETRPVSDVVPLLDSRCSLLDAMGVLRTVSFYSTDKTLKLYLWAGHITDKERFTKVFGPMEEPKRV